MSTGNHLPPRWADNLVARLAQGHLADEIRGDLLEIYSIDVKKIGVRRARRQYVINALGFLAKNFFWRGKKQNLYYTSMSGSYFKMARRSLLANKGTTLINILGLVIGIASALVIANVVRFEQSFDSFHSKKDNIWRLVRVEGSDNPGYRSGISHPVPMALRDEIPGITVAPMEYLGATDVDVVMGNGQPVKKFNEPDGFVAIEPGFFEMFDFEDKPLHWIAGNPEKSLSEPTGIVITKAMAKKYFGNDDPMGKTLNLQKVMDVKVTGVVDDFPANTDFPFKLMISYETLRNLYGEERINNWVSVNDNHHAYIYAPGMSKQELEERIGVVHAKHVDKDMAARRHYRLQEFKEVHFDPRFGNFSGRTITHETILALQIIVIFLLLAGCINYINLSTAQSTLRSKEIGLRKVMGGQQRQLVMQFLTETFVVVAIAVVAAVILVITLMPSIKNLLNLPMSYDLTDPFILTSLAAVVISITLFAGFYPALMISRFNPVATLRAKFSSEKVAGVNLRKVLVVTQFTITQILAVGTFIVISQMNFFENVDMGFNRKAVVISMPLWNSNPQPRRATERELKTLPFVSGVSSSFTLPSGVVRHRSSRTISHMDAQTMNDYLSYEHFSIDESFLDLYQIKLIAGRNLMASDSSTDNLLINETLMKNLGFESPEASLGSFVKVNGNKATIVGVIGDFYSNSLKEEADNTAMVFRTNEYRRMSVRLDLKPDESMTNALSEIEKVWNKNYPDYLFQYTFMDDNINAFYQQEFKYSKLFQIFSTIFIGIGCLGLYGLISFIANKKGKEIAIRKTLGATISNIIVMFSREYVVLIGISFALALPVAWYGVNEWLSSFKNQVALHWWMFAAPGAMVLMIALLVVGSKSYNAASVNPVEKLKCE